MGAFAERKRKQLGGLDPDDPNAPDAERPLDEGDEELPEITGAPANPEKTAKKLAKAIGEKDAPAHPHTEAPSVTPEETRPFRNTGPDLAGQLRAEAADVVDPMNVAGRAAKAAATGVGTMATDAMNAGTFGAYQGARDLVADAVAPGAAAATRDAEDKFRTDHPVASSTASAVGLLNPYGAPNAIAKTATAVGQKLIPQAVRAAVPAPIAAGVTGGAVGGATAAAESPEPFASRDFVRDVARGSTLGAGTGLATYGLGKYVTGAPKRVQQAADRELLGKSSGPERAALLDKSGAVKPEMRELQASTPALKTAAKKGDYQGMQDLASKHLDDLSAKTEKIYADYAAKVGNKGPAPAVQADPAAPPLPPPTGSAASGLPPGRPSAPKLVPPTPEVIPDALAAGALDQLKALRDHAAKPLTAGGKGADSAYVAKLDGIIERIGPGGKLDAKQLRTFMTEQVGVKPGEANVAPRGADAQNDAYFALRDKVMQPEIKRVLGDKAAAELETSNAQMSRWMRVQDIAAQQAMKTAGKDGIKPFTSIPRRTLGFINDNTSKALATDSVQRAATAAKGSPGVLPSVAATPGNVDVGAAVKAATGLLRDGVTGAKDAYDFLFGPRGKDAGGYDPNRPGGP